MTSTGIQPHGSLAIGGFRLTTMSVGLGLYLGLLGTAQAVGTAGAIRTVEAGENLSRVAESYCQPGERLCIRQHILAILRANPEQFPDGARSGLEIGQRLRMPPESEIEAIPADEAMAVYGLHSAPAPAEPAAVPARSASARSVQATTAAVLPPAAGLRPAAAPSEPLRLAQTGPIAGSVPVAVPPTVAAPVPLPVAPPVPVPPAAAAAASGSPAPGRASEISALPPLPAEPPAAAAAPSTGFQDENPSEPAKTDFQATDATPSGEPVPPPAIPAPAPASTPVRPPAPAAAPAPAGRIRVPYIPETEKKRIRDEIRQDVLETARRENWAQPEAVPDWVKRLKLSADLMVRGEGQLNDRANNNLFFNFQAINAGAPVNTTPPADVRLITIPFLNTTEDRRLMRLRARLGLAMTVSPQLSMSLRLATGNAVSPVSTNQTLGNDFNKLNLLLDRAYLRYQPAAPVALSLGRMPNPYATALDLVWDRDLSFDGLSVQWTRPLLGGSARLAPGFYSVENTDPNYPGNSFNKTGSYDKWLAALQAEWSGQLGQDRALRASVAYYDFLNFEGQLSSVCIAPSAAIACDTDNSRPGFVQKGNTMFAIRNLFVANPGSDPSFQYFGLASEFQVLEFSAGFDSRLHGPLHLAVDAAFAYNLAFDVDEVKARIPVNNFGPCLAGTGTCVQQLEAGNSAYQAQARVGHPQIRQRGDWQAQLGYRYVESDALPDAFTDSDFHLGGTNAKGYYLGGSLGFAGNAWLSLRYLSATEVSGPPLANDLLQLDVNVRF